MIMLSEGKGGIPDVSFDANSSTGDTRGQAPSDGAIPARWRR